MSELPVDQLLTVSRAIAIIDATPVSPRIERVKIEHAAGRRLAADILANRDDPPFDKSLMDGFAVRADGPTTLTLVGEIPAGTSATRVLAKGEAMSIMTGAPIPPGADAVVPIEQTSRDDQSVLLQMNPKLGQSIARRGSDCAAGTVVLRKGDLLGSAQIAVAASVGASMMDVFAKPRVAVLSTGDEIVPVDKQPGLTQIRNSNSHMLRSLLTNLGCEVTDLGIVADEPELIRQAMEEGMRSDVLFVTGGMSMGAYDYVPRLLVEMGVEMRITKLRIKPGKPFVFGIKRHRFIFGLPGNPVSGYVCTLRLAARLLARMSGGDPNPKLINPILAKPLPANGPREFYQPGVLDGRGGIMPLDWKGSADIYTLAAADALIIRAENELRAPAGSIVQALPMS